MHKRKFLLVHRSKKFKAVDLLCLANSSLTLMLPCCSNVANLFCHIPSIIMMASSSPCFTQSMIWRLKCWYPHLAKCLPSGVRWSSISLLCPECLLCIASVVFPVYWEEHAWHVTKYTTYVDLHVRLCLMFM